MATESQCGIRNSSPIVIEVFEPLSEDMGISSYTELPLCNDNNGVLLTLDIMPTGGGEGFTYQWQEVGLDLDGQTQTDLAVPFLENSTSYQLFATSNEGCGIVPSNAIEVVVYDPLEIADAQGAQTICFMTEPMNNSPTLEPWAAAPLTATSGRRTVEVTGSIWKGK